MYIGPKGEGKKERDMAQDRTAENQGQTAPPPPTEKRVHPFTDDTRRTDLWYYPPIPGALMQIKEVTVHAADERSVEFSDEKGNYYRVANMPYTVCSYDPQFDPDTEGRIIRGTGSGLA
jgi:hypothetical protein